MSAIIDAAKYSPTASEAVIATTARMSSPNSRRISCLTMSMTVSRMTNPTNTVATSCAAVVRPEKCSARTTMSSTSTAASSLYSRKMRITVPILQYCPIRGFPPASYALPNRDGSASFACVYILLLSAKTRPKSAIPTEFLHVAAETGVFARRSRVKQSQAASGRKAKAKARPNSEP